MDGLAVPHVRVVIVVVQEDSQTPVDELLVVEEDDLDVTRRLGPDRQDQVSGRGVVVGGVVDVGRVRAFGPVLSNRPDVDVEPVLMAGVAGDVPTVLQADVADSDGAVAVGVGLRRGRFNLADRRGCAPVRGGAVARSVVVT